MTYYSVYFKDYMHLKSSSLSQWDRGGWYSGNQTHKQFQVLQVAPIPEAVRTKTDTESGIWILYLGPYMF